MTRTHKNISTSLESKPGAYTRSEAVDGIAQALQLMSGRWKLEILFCLFGGRVRRYSELERAIPQISQKMLAQQLRQLEADGIVERTIYPEVPPRVEYRLTDWGQSLCPTLDSLLKWLSNAPSNASSPEA